VKRSLLEPIPELELAAKLLDSAADALLIGKEKLAASLISEADLPEIMAYAIRLVGKLSPEVHRLLKRPLCLPSNERNSARMPSAATQAAIFSRDGWRCRFCGVKVISKAARTILIRRFPSESHWSGPEFQRHSALFALASSLDHVVPHGRGGRNELSNFVTACYCCQFGRGEWTLEEMALEDPRVRAPIVGDWDGLIRITHMPTNNSFNPKPLHRST
jgi:hypothetical protein